jgi:hypothetical protein
MIDSSVWREGRDGRVKGISRLRCRLELVLDLRMGAVLEGRPQ